MCGEDGCKNYIDEVWGLGSGFSCEDLLVRVLVCLVIVIVVVVYVGIVFILR